MNHPYDSEELSKLLEDWHEGTIARGEFEDKLEKLVDRHRAVEAREIADLRALVKRTCHTPLFIAGRFVPIDNDQRTAIMRTEIATYDEMIDALELHLRWIHTANLYLRTQVKRDISSDPIVAATCVHCSGPPHVRKLGEPLGCPSAVECNGRGCDRVVKRSDATTLDWHHDSYGSWYCPSHAFLVTSSA